MTTKISNIFPERFQELRKKAGLSQRELGLKLGKTQVAISTWEKGTRKPSVEDIGRLADIFECAPAYLTGWDLPTLALQPEPPKWLAELMPALVKLDGAGQSAVKALLRGLGVLSRFAPAEERKRLAATVNDLVENIARLRALLAIEPSSPAVDEELALLADQLKTLEGNEK